MSSVQDNHDIVELGSINEKQNNSTGIMAVALKKMQV